MNQCEVLRNSYHTIIKSLEYEKYKKRKKLDRVWFTKEEVERLGISTDVFQTLLKKGFIVRIGENKFRSLLMDVAFRASDIRIKWKGTKYVLESKLKLEKRPFLHVNAVKFEETDKDFLKLKEKVLEILEDEKLTKHFFEALIKAGITGLSKYQFRSIMELLTKPEKFVVISAPTAFGKTYIFLFPALLYAIKAVKEGKSNTAIVMFYPRKSLGSDQMGRLIKLVYYVNEICNVNVTIGIDDGDVKRFYKEVEEYRGIKCPIHEEETLLIKNNKIFCKKCKRFFDFIRVTRKDFEKEGPTILITNIWAYQYRIVDPLYWKNGYLSENIKLFIFDEIHAYRSLVAGILRYFIRTLMSLVSSNARIVFSSATIPKLKEFIEELSGVSFENILSLKYDERIYGKDFEKLEIYLLVGIDPRTSWETYTHELAIFLSTVNRLQKHLGFQSLIFVDGIRNITRLYRQAVQAIEMGDPKDHLQPSIEPHDSFCYWVYNEEYKTTKEEVVNKLREEIKANIDTHYSDKSNRFEVEERIKTGKVDVVFTTSTLELGVDYKKVSVIVNAGIPFSVESIIQRVGRAGRDEEETLLSSLSIIIVRNNPLEYFYLYKGIDELTKLEKLPKIPVSYSNLFVIFYSVLLYTLSYLVKHGRIVEVLKESGAKQLEKIEKSIVSLKPKIFDAFGIEFDVSGLREKLRKIISILQEENVEKKFEKIRLFIEEKRLKSDLKENIYPESVELVEKSLLKVDKVGEKEKDLLKERLTKIKELLRKLKEEERKDTIIDLLYSIINYFHFLRNRIRNSLHPLFKERAKIDELKYRMGKIRNRLEDLETVEKFEIKEEKVREYLEAEQVLKILQEDGRPTSKLIKAFEEIIGFRFMGNEFIDQAVEIGPELSLGQDIKTYFLSSIISRMPPFELVVIPFESKEQGDITKLVGARHFWIIKPRRGFWVYSSTYGFRENLEKNVLGNGKGVKTGNLVIPQNIKLIDLLSTKKPFIFKMESIDGRPLYLKYGSEKINSYKVKGKYAIHENIRTLYSLLPSSEKFRTVKTFTQHALTLIHHNLQSRGNRWGLNFSYPAICMLGYCISTDPFDLECPVKDICQRCDGKRCWSATPYKKRSGKRRIFPKFHLKLEVRNLPPFFQPLLFSVSTLTYDALIEDVEFLYPSVTVSLPVRFGDYMFREFEIEPIGYTARTSLIILSFNDSLLDIVLKELIKNNPKLLKLLKLKYFLFREVLKLRSSLDASIKLLKYDENAIDENSKDFLEFTKYTLIHTLAHLFYLYLVTTKVPIDPEKIVYYINNSTIFILENSKNNGMGLVETIKKEIKEVGEWRFLKEFIEWSLENFLLPHHRDFERKQKELKKEAENALRELSNLKIFKEIRKLQEKIKELNEELKSRVDLAHIDLITYRHLLTWKLQEEYDEDLSEYLLTLVNAEGIPKLCSDGCNECLIFYRNCSEPFLQNYTISKLLVLEFLRTLRRGNVSVVGKGLGKSIEKLMEGAEKIILKVPFIDEFGYSFLKRLKQKDKEIIVISQNKDMLSKLSKEGIKTFQLKGFHAKIYYLESKENKILLQGSVNLTYRGFYENEENISIIWEPSTVLRIEKELRKYE